MRFFGLYRQHLKLGDSNVEHHLELKPSELKIAIFTISHPRNGYAGRIQLSFENVGNSDLNDLYLHLILPKDILLFNRDMYLGSNEKNWKIDLLEPGNRFTIIFDVRLKKRTNQVNGILSLTNFSSRFGETVQNIDVKLDLLTSHKSDHSSKQQT